MESVIMEQNRPEPERKPTKDASFWGICLGHTFTHWYPATFYILLPYITLELGLSVTQAGLLVTMMYVAKSVFSMPIGAITDMTRRKNLLMGISLTLAGLPFIFLGFAHMYWLIMLLVMIMGIGNEMWHPASFSSLSKLYPKQRGFAFGVHGMSANLWDLLAPAIIGAIIATFDWRGVVVWNVIPGIVIGLVVLYLLRGTDVESNKSKKKNQADGQSVTSLADYKKGIVELFHNRSVLLLSLASGIRSMTQNGLMTFLPLYLAFEIGLSPLWVGVFVTVMQGGGLLAAPIMGGASDKVGRRKIIFSGMIVTSILVVAVVLVRIEWLVIVTMALLGFALYSLRPVMQAWAMETTKKNMAGTTTSMLFTTQAIMSASSPLIGGILADQYGISAAFYFIAAIILVGNAVVAFIPKEVGQAS